MSQTSRSRIELGVADRATIKEHIDRCRELELNELSALDYAYRTEIIGCFIRTIDYMAQLAGKLQSNRSQDEWNYWSGYVVALEEVTSVLRSFTATSIPQPTQPTAKSTTV